MELKFSVRRSSMFQIVVTLLCALSLCSITSVSAATVGMDPLLVDTIYLNGKIVTMNEALDSTNTVEAVAVSGDKISAVGRADDIKKMANSETRVVDLKGGTMFPGFIDPHSHFFYSAEYAYGWIDLNSPPIGNVTSIDEMISLLKKKAATTPKGEWILGWGYDDTNIKDMRHPTREDLDKASTEHPIFIQHISGWLSSANSLALEKASITKDTPDPSGGRILKDPETSEPTGVIESASLPVLNAAPKSTEADLIKAMESGSEMYLAAGCTTAQEGWTDLRQYKILEKALEQGTLKIRTIVWPVAQGKHAKDKGEYPTAISGESVDDNHMLVYGASKLTADGSIQGYTGYLTNPYQKQQEGKIGYRGYPTHPRKNLIDMVVKLHQEGRQIAIHGNGDAAIDDILDALEIAQQTYPRADARHIVVHSQMVREDQLDRMNRLGAIPSFFVTHTYFWGDRHSEFFMGPDRAVRMSPVQSALRRGMRFTLHNDTYVTPISPLMAVWSAVNRKSSSGMDMGKENQGISQYEALKGVTIHAAWQGFEEKIKGSIETGKLADFVVLEKNPLTVDPLLIKDIKIRATIIGNKIAHGSL